MVRSRTIESLAFMTRHRTMLVPGCLLVAGLGFAGGAMAAGGAGSDGAEAVRHATPAAHPAADTVDQELPSGVTPAMVEEGEEIFNGAGICLTCHGEEGAGTPIGPALADGEWIHIDGSYGSIVELVKEGVEVPVEYPTPMLPRGGSQISDEQVEAVSAYVWLLSRGG